MVENSGKTPRLALRRWVRVVLVSSGLGLAGCSTVIDVAEMEYFDDSLKPKKEKIFQVATQKQCEKTRQRMEEIKNYIISVDNEGRYEPITQKLYAGECNETIMVEQPELFGDHAKNIIKSIFAKEDGPKNILIFIHGGLNTSRFSRNRAIEQSFIISRYKEKGARRYYPLFINWNSGLTSSYMERILFIRQGRRIKGIQAYMTAPLNLVSDIAQAIARIPSTWEKSTSRLIRTKYFNKLKPCDEIKKNKEQYKVAANLICDGKSRGSFDEADRTFRFIASWPFRLLGSPLADAFGETAWVSMLRRTKLIFRTPEEFENFDAPAESDRPDEPAFNGQANVSSFLRLLQAALSKNENPDEYSITLIGHSMGAIIANDIIRYFPKLPYKDIVYMAAASSISQAQETLVPLLFRPGNKVKFYHLMLHPDAESREYTLGGIGPTGSLLEWIDQYYTNPSTMTDRRFGKWRNLFYIRTMIPRRARKYMTFKVFGFTRELNNPMRHGDFADTSQCYWRPEFWKTQVYRGESNSFCRYATGNGATAR